MILKAVLVAKQQTAGGDVIASFFCFVTDRNVTRSAKKLNMAADFWCKFKRRRVCCVLI
jgi:hypothetical protein